MKEAVGRTAGDRRRVVALLAAASADRADKPRQCRRFGGVERFSSMVMPVLLRVAVCLAAVGDVRAEEPASEVAAAVRVPVVEVRTSMGAIVLELDPAKSPETVANFLKYVKGGHYDGTVFHRVVAGCMILGGGFEKKGDQLVEKPANPPIKNEAANGLPNVEGTIAMARTEAPDTATSQFFINCRNNDMLNHVPPASGYAVFGKVTKGMDVVKQISAVAVGVREVNGRLVNGQLRPMPLKGVPLSDVVIESVRLLREKPPKSDEKPDQTDPTDPSDPPEGRR